MICLLDVNVLLALRYVRSTYAPRQSDDMAVGAYNG